MDNEILKKYFDVGVEKSMKVKGDHYVEIRLADDYFTSGISAVIGDMVQTFAFFDMYIWDSYKEDLSDSDAIVVKMRMPTIIDTKPGRIIHDPKHERKILEYFGGDQIIVSTVVAKSVLNVIKYFEIVLKGKVPADIPYNEIGSYIEKCAEINSFNMKVNSIFIDLIVMMVCRDPKNLSRQFREAIKDNPKISMYDRKLVNLDVIPALTSQFSAITSGNPKYGMTSSIGAVRSGDMELTESDIEEVIK